MPAILAVSGSLRQASVNTAALRAAAAAAARSGIAVSFDDAPRALPQFDPDLEASPPEAAARFRSACEQADALLFAVPEYAFGIPGAFKNALDWTVGAGSLDHKPVALLHVAPPGRGARVREALTHVLTALAADVTHHELPIGRHDRDARGRIADPLIVERLALVVVELATRATQAALSRG